MPPEDWIQHWKAVLYHWQSLAAGLVALLAALVAVLGAEFFARCKERREIQALRASLASEIRLYVDLLIMARLFLTRGKEAFRLGAEPNFRDLAALPPPIVYPAAADRLGHVRRPSAADVVEFYAFIERINFFVGVMSKMSSNEPSMPSYPA